MTSQTTTSLVWQQIAPQDAAVILHGPDGALYVTCATCRDQYWPLADNPGIWPQSGALQAVEAVLTHWAGTHSMPPALWYSSAEDMVPLPRRIPSEQR